MTTDQNSDPKIPNWGLPAFSWLISFYFLAGFVADLGFPPSTNISVGHAVLLALWLFFLFLPFFKRVKIGKLLELEREVEKAKTELQEFKQEVRANLSLISTNVNTIGNLSNQVTVNLPGLADLEEVKRRLDEESKSPGKKELQEIRSGLLLEGEDTAMALARTRMQIEYLLRKILGKRTKVPGFKDKPLRFLSLQKLFKLFLEQYDEFNHLKQPFSYVTQVCNAAIHAQRVPEQQAEEALDIGARIIATLSRIADAHIKMKESS